MITAKNCTYEEQCITLYDGGITIDLENKAVFVNLNNEHQMFDGWTDDIAVALSHKPQDFHVCNGNTILSSGIKSTTLIVTQGKAEYKKNLDDVAIAPFLKGVELSGYEWLVESDLSRRSFVISR
ncbi:conserved hypothetical protein [Vibrio jasicida]|uniref:Uncharacterized protein n=1 Tax=Vibrio jasicida TaxID=766224 RepID=A0AAU9QR01_9VIBR|nr:conserved hypothetical protein [Vibrio jasicida]CAH1599326.1 conserved hypothetical protein [Vibrio jasicida]